MGKSYVENSLKRFLKRKVKITLGFVVAFMITGACAFAESTAEEGSTQWHKEQAEKWLKGYGKNVFPAVSGDKVSITADGKINFDEKEIDLSSVKGNLSDKEKNILTAMGNIVNGKDNTIDFSGVEGYNEGLNAEISNKGILEKAQLIVNGAGYNYGVINVTANDVQNIGGNAKGYNYGIINTTGRNAQRVGASGSAYNFGIINADTGYVQITWGKDVSLYNYGILTSNKTFIQSVEASDSKGYNYGVLLNKAGYLQYVNGQSEIYNYGIIKSDSTTGCGQVVKKNGTAYNYGLIDVTTIGQAVTDTSGNIYNYGIISTVSGAGMSHSLTGEAKNYGVLKNGSGKIFAGHVDNYGMVILTDANKQTIEANGLGTGVNKGVVLDKDYKLLTQEINGEKVNNHVTNLTNSGTVDGTSDKTYYAKDIAVEFSTSKLEGNVLTAVVTEKDKTAFKYTGDDKLVLKDSSVMGYFLASGTLLELGKDKELVLTNSKINTVVGVGSDVADVTAVKLDGGTLTLAGESEIAGKVIGKGTTGYISIHNDNQNIALESGNINLTNDDGTYGLSKTNTEVTFNTIKADNLNLDFTVNTNKDVNKVTLNNAELKSIDGSSSTEKIELTLDSTEKVGNITLGQNDDKFIVTNSSHNGIIDMGAGDNDEFNVSFGIVESEHKKEAGNTFDYKVNGAEKIVLNGDGWHIGENAELNAGTTTKAGEKTELHIADKGSLHVDMNNNYGAGNVTTSLDKMADGADLSLSTGTDAEVKFVVGDKFDVSQKQFDVAHSYSVAGANLGTAVIFKGTGTDGAVEEKDGKISLTVKEASEVGLSGYEGIYNAVLKGLSKDDDLRNAVNYQDESNLVSMIKTAGETAEAFYTTGYAVTKDVTDTYMSVVEDFGRKAGKGEWIAYGKYVNSDTEFDGGKSSKGYDGDITGTVGMIEYGVNETTSYGVVYGQGDTEVDIQGGGKLDGDNTYFGGYVKHRTQNGIDLTGNIGITKSELDLSLATNTKTQGGVNHHIITDGNSDADALTFSIKGTKDYKVTDTIRLQPVVSGRYSFISQDEVTSSDANFKMDEQDITIFEGAFGGNIIKDFDIYNGRLSLSAGAEYVLTDVNKDDNARYHLYNEDLHFTGEEDIADNRIEGHIGIDYEHESGVGVDAKYEMIWTDKGDNSRVTAGISYRF
ncbi:autotransporter domain-containing protein [Fusobacterium sp. SB021]|uniref:autotransporter outer membrane beta-barrel domain-containing protein n=1 Tax=Fusobacterium sp. SB021 TaxID=2744227 RepID=UPI003CF6A31E